MSFLYGFVCFLDEYNSECFFYTKKYDSDRPIKILNSFLIFIKFTWKTYVSGKRIVLKIQTLSAFPFLYSNITFKNDIWIRVGKAENATEIKLSPLL